MVFENRQWVIVIVPKLTTDQKLKRTASTLSLGSNICLTILKAVAGTLSGSVSILAEAAHSASDLVASAFTFYSVRQADLPADEEHPYGHGKVENLAALSEAVLLFAVAIYVVREAVDKLIHHSQPGSLGMGMVVMGVSALVNIFVVRYVLRVGRETDSQSLQAVAEDHRADVITAAGVLIGLVLVRVTGYGFFDPLLAILVSLVILRTAWRLARAAVAPLMDTRLSQEDVDAVRKVLETHPDVQSYHKLRTRQAGAVRHVDAHVLMDDNLTLAQAHDLTEDVEDRIREILPNAEVTLHTEPYHAEQEHQQAKHGAGLPQ